MAVWFANALCSLGTRSYWEQRASLLGARTLLGAPGIATRNKKLVVAFTLFHFIGTPQFLMDPHGRQICWEVTSVMSFKELVVHVKPLTGDPLFAYHLLSNAFLNDQCNDQRVLSERMEGGAFSYFR